MLTPLVTISDSIAIELILFVMSLGIGVMGWYVKKIDSRVDIAERNKVDKDAFLEFKTDIKKEFESLHRDLSHADKGSNVLSVHMAVLNEKMTRVELLLQRCPGCFAQYKTTTKEGEEWLP